MGEEKSVLKVFFSFIEKIENGELLWEDAIGKNLHVEWLFKLEGDFLRSVKRITRVNLDLGWAIRIEEEMMTSTEGTSIWVGIRNPMAYGETWFFSEVKLTKEEVNRIKRAVIRF